MGPGASCGAAVRGGDGEGGGNKGRSPPPRAAEPSLRHEDARGAAGPRGAAAAAQRPRSAGECGATAGCGAGGGGVGGERARGVSTERWLGGGGLGGGRGCGEWRLKVTGKRLREKPAGLGCWPPPEGSPRGAVWASDPPRDGAAPGAVLRAAAPGRGSRSARLGGASAWGAPSPSPSLSEEKSPHFWLPASVQPAGFKSTELASLLWGFSFLVPPFLQPHCWGCSGVGDALGLEMLW